MIIQLNAIGLLAIMLIAVMSPNQTNAASMLVCSVGSYIERANASRPQRANLSISLALFTDESSEVLVGSRDNATVGKRQVYFDSVALDSDEILIGYNAADGDTGPYWSLDPRANTLMVSLEDIIVRGEQCVDMGHKKAAVLSPPMPDWVTDLLEVFDNACYRVQGNYDDVVRTAQAFDYQKMPPEVTTMILGIDSESGTSFLVERDPDSEAAILLAASVPSACSVAGRGISVDGVRKALVANFQLLEIQRDTVGMQVSEFYVPEGTAGTRSEVAERGLIVLTYPKHGSEPIVTVGYLPAGTAIKALSQ